MLEEGRVVGAGAEVADADVGIDARAFVARRLAETRRGGLRLVLGFFHLLVDRAARGRGHLCGDLAQEPAQRGHGGGA